MNLDLWVWISKSESVISLDLWLICDESEWIFESESVMSLDLWWIRFFESGSLSPDESYLWLEVNTLLCALGSQQLSPCSRLSGSLLSSYTHSRRFSRRSRTPRAPVCTGRPPWCLAASPQGATCTPGRPRMAGRSCGRRGPPRAARTPGSSYICPERTRCRDSWGSDTSSRHTGRRTCPSARLQRGRA